MAPRSRREFTALIGAAAAFPLVPAASAQVPPPATAPPPPENGAVHPMGRAVAGVLAARYPHLTPEDLDELTREISESALWLERMRKFPLANADEPDFAFLTEE